MILTIFLILALLLVCFFVFYDLPKSQGKFATVISFMCLLMFGVICRKHPEIPLPKDLIKISKIDHIISAYETEMKLQLPYTGYSQSLKKNDSLFVIPSIVSYELKINDKKLDEFDRNQIFLVQLTKNKNIEMRQPHGTVWGVYDGKSDPLKKIKKQHNAFVLNYFWNYLLVIPFTLSLIHKRKRYIAKNLLALMLLVGSECIRLYFFTY
jgi:hypothetical protein